MTVRPAKFEDIPEVAGVMQWAYEHSIYADRATFDLVQAKQLCARSMHRHGHRNYGGTLFLVSETDGEVRGFIIGFIDLVYPCLQEFMVTDLGFVLRDDANPADAPRMVNTIMGWAKLNPKVIEVHLGLNDAMTANWTRVAKMYERLGLEQCGGIYRILIERNELEAQA